MTRFFFINLGITCLSTVILYLYFRNKIGKMEQKVDLMFQLIQEYNQQQQANNNNNQTQQMSNSNNWINKQDDLISVSDDENDDLDSDSDEISDDESIPLNISEEPVNDNIKTINLAGAEIDSMQAEPSDNLDDISDIDNSENNIITLDEIYDNQSENNDNIIEEHNDNTITNTDIKEINIEEDKPLKNYTVKELKAECEKRGFINYKALRKTKLIDLLEKNPIAENNI